MKGNLVIVIFMLLVHLRLFGQGNGSPLSNMEKQTVLVVVSYSTSDGEAGVYSFGSGLVIGERYVVTNKHVVPTNDDLIAQGINPDVVDQVTLSYQVVVGSDEFYEAVIFNESYDKDLAILKTKKGLNRPPVTFSRQQDVEKAQEVYAMGFPSAGMRGEESVYEVKITKGIISAFIQDEGGRKLYQVDAAINPGNSGGPLFDKCGNVVGINVEKSLVPVQTEDGRSVRVPEGDNVGWSIVIDELLQELKDLDIPFKEAPAKCPVNPPNYDDTELKEKLKSTEVYIAGMKEENQKLKNQQDSLNKALLAKLSTSREEESSKDNLMIFILVLAILLALTGIVISATKGGRKAMQGAVSTVTGRVKVPKQANEQGPSPVRSPSSSPPTVIRDRSGLLAIPETAITGEIYIGRDSANCQLVFPAEAGKISRIHAVIFADDHSNQIVIKDLNSSNGTLVNNKKLLPETPRKLSRGDLVHFGDRKFGVELG